MGRSKLNVTYGIHAVRSLLQRQSDKVEEVIFVVSKKGPLNARLEEIQGLAKSNGISVQFLSPENFDQSELKHHVAKDSAHQNVFAIAYQSLTQQVDFKAWRKKQAQKDKSIVLMLDQVTDPHNLGACLRTADGAGVDLIIIPKDNAAGLNATVRKVAAGATENVPVYPVANLVRALEDLKQDGFWIYGLSDEVSQSIFDTNWPDKVVLVMGAEGKGLRRLVEQACDENVFIPMQGVVESLNVSVATGIVLYDVVRQHNKNQH